MINFILGLAAGWVTMYLFKSKIVWLFGKIFGQKAVDNLPPSGKQK